MSGDPNARVELTPRQQADIAKYLKIHSSPQSSDREKEDAAGQLAGYMRAVLRKKS